MTEVSGMRNIDYPTCASRSWKSKRHALL